MLVKLKLQKKIITGNQGDVPDASKPEENKKAFPARGGKGSVCIL